VSIDKSKFKRRRCFVTHGSRSIRGEKLITRILGDMCALGGEKQRYSWIECGKLSWVHRASETASKA
jgi:hypothetical protein